MAVLGIYNTMWTEKKGGVQARIQSPNIGGAQVISMKLPLILTQNQPTG